MGKVQKSSNSEVLERINLTEILSWHFFGVTEETHRKLSVIIASVPAEI
jgi:hypothetical protein